MTFPPNFIYTAKITYLYTLNLYIVNCTNNLTKFFLTLLRCRQGRFVDDALSEFLESNRLSLFSFARICAVIVNAFCIDVC